MLLSISAFGYPGYDFNDDLSEPLLTLRFQGPADKDVKKRLKQKPTEDEEYDLSRFKPLVRTVISVCHLSL